MSEREKLIGWLEDMVSDGKWTAPEVVFTRAADLLRRDEEAMRDALAALEDEFGDGKTVSNVSPQDAISKLTEALK